MLAKTSTKRVKKHKATLNGGSNFRWQLENAQESTEEMIGEVTAARSTGQLTHRKDADTQSSHKKAGWLHNLRNV